MNVFLIQLFKRPGRIDNVVHFDFATKGQIKHMYERFLPAQVENSMNFIRKLSIVKLLLRYFRLSFSNLCQVKI